MIRGLHFLKYSDWEQEKNHYFVDLSALIATMAAPVLPRSTKFLTREEVAKCYMEEGQKQNKNKYFIKLKIFKVLKIATSKS